MEKRGCKTMGIFTKFHFCRGGIGSYVNVKGFYQVLILVNDQYYIYDWKNPSSIFLEN